MTIEVDGVIVRPTLKDFACLKDPESAKALCYIYSLPPLDRLKRQPHPDTLGNRNDQILFRYVTVPGITHRQLGEEFGLKRSERGERVRQIIEETCRRYVPLCPPELQDQLPEISTKKHHRMVENNSSQARWSRLKAQLADPSLDDPTAQHLLDTKVSKYFYLRNVLGENSLLWAVSRLAREQGYFVKGRDVNPFYQAIQEAGIPLGRIRMIVTGGKYPGRVQNYYFVLRRHGQRVLQAWQENSDLKQYSAPLNPVKIHSRAEFSEMLMPGQLKNQSRFSPVEQLFARLGIDRQWADVLRENGLFYTLTGIPILHHPKYGTFYLVDQEAALERWVVNFAEQFEAINR